MKITELAQDILGSNAIHFQEWQYETAAPYYRTGRIRKYPFGYTAAFVDAGGEWMSVIDEDGEDSWPEFAEAYNALGHKIHQIGPA